MSAATDAARGAGDDNEVMASVKAGSVNALGVLYGMQALVSRFRGGSGAADVTRVCWRVDWPTSV